MSDYPDDVDFAQVFLPGFSPILAARPVNPDGLPKLQRETWEIFLEHTRKHSGKLRPYQGQTYPGYCRQCHAAVFLSQYNQDARRWLDDNGREYAVLCMPCISLRIALQPDTEADRENAENLLYDEVALPGDGTGDA